jgi:hypothetical protein
LVLNNERLFHNLKKKITQYNYNVFIVLSGKNISFGFRQTRSATLTVIEKQRPYLRQHSVSVALSCLLSLNFLICKMG